jgi:hypothetical protein
MPKYKFRPGEKPVITVDLPKAPQGSQVRRGEIIPYVEPEYPGRRLGEPQIRFWDLAQVNHQDLDEEPFWEDHPILKTPSYTTQYETWGSLNNRFQGVGYLLEPFEDADYQSYTDLFFNYPVTEWKQRYRRIKRTRPYDSENPSDYGFDMRFSLRDDTYSGDEEKVMPRRELAISQLPTSKETYLTDYHHYWHREGNYAGYRDLDRLEGQINPWGFDNLPISGGYFPYSTNRTNFKVTATNDPDASPVTLGDPTGSYDVFLVPQIGMFMAVSHSSDWKTSEVLGLCYQVMPRYLWPRYNVEGVLETPGDLGITDAAIEGWLEYQKTRSGMQYSTWTYTGSGGVSDFSYSETAGVPNDWTGQTKWGGALNGTYLTTNYYYLTQYRGSGIVLNNQPDYTTFFQADSEDDNFGFQLFRSESPLLTAVIQKGSSFYYVWDTSHQNDGFGNFTAFETIDQDDRFNLYQDITWAGALSGGVYPKDGTGGFFDL